MPEISRFLGIVIRMYFRDHAPPHFHAEYGEYEITVEIGTGVVAGKFPRQRSPRCSIGMSCTNASWWRTGISPARKRLNKIEPLE